MQNQAKPSNANMQLFSNQAEPSNSALEHISQLWLRLSTVKFSVVTELVRCGTLAHQARKISLIMRQRHLRAVTRPGSLAAGGKALTF